MKKVLVTLVSACALAAGTAVPATAAEVPGGPGGSTTACPVYGGPCAHVDWGCVIGTLEGNQYFAPCYWVRTS